MTDKEIVERAKEAEKRTGFGELVHSPISKGVNSAYGIGFIEGMVEYRNSLQEESVSEELIIELKSIVNIRELAHQGIPVVKIARHIANWQKNQMIKNATEAIVHIDAGGYPYIPQIELYDYDKDIPLAKKGDKYKVVLIKDD